MAGRPEEYLWRKDVARWRERWNVSTEREYLDATLREGTTQNGVFGARIMWPYLGEAVDLLATATGVRGSPLEVFAAAFPGLRYIHLRRRDHLAQALSWAKAVQADIWYAADNRSGPPTPPYDRDLIRNLLGLIEEADRGWSELLAASDLTSHPVDYEDLVADPHGTAADLLRFIGTWHDGLRLSVTTERQADATNAAWIEQYRRDMASGV